MQVEEGLRVFERTKLVFARSTVRTVVPALIDVPRQAKVRARDLEELRALARIAHPLGRVHALQRLAMVLVAFGHGGDPGVCNLNR